MGSQALHGKALAAATLPTAALTHHKHSTPSTGFDELYVPSGDAWPCSLGQRRHIFKYLQIFLCVGKHTQFAKRFLTFR